MFICLIVFLLPYIPLFPQLVLKPLNQQVNPLKGILHINNHSTLLTHPSKIYNQIHCWKGDSTEHENQSSSHQILGNSR